MKGQNKELSSYMFGKVQPQALDLEQAVLGALLTDKDAIYSIADLLHNDLMYSEKHQIILNAIRDLYRSTSPIDLLTITERLRKVNKLDKIGGAWYLVELTNRVASSANIERHSRILMQKMVRRELISVSSKVIEGAYNDTKDVFDLLDNVDSKMINIRDSFTGGTVENNTTIANKVRKQIEAAKNSTDDVLGLRMFGINELDKILNGAEKDDFILIGGRPSMGKSSLGNSALLNAVKMDIPCCFWSIEMTNEKSFLRLVSALSQIPYSKITKGKCDYDEDKKVAKAIETIEKSRIIFRTDNVNIYQYRSEIYKMKRKNSIEWSFFDRIGLMKKTNPSFNDYAHVSELTPILRATANELQIPQVAINQLSRQVEIRGGSKRPMLSDLRNSGTLEQDATKVIFCYRPEYYDILEDEDGNSLLGVGELIVAKNGNGLTDSVKTKFIGERMVFTDYNEFEMNDNDFQDSVNSLKTTPNPNTIIRSRTKDDDIPF